MKEVKKPWGVFKRFVLNKKCTVKVLEIKPRQELSLQKHKKRKEDWYFLSPGVVQIGERRKKVKEGEMVKIGRNVVHKIVAGDKKVSVLEISFGNFSENDEIRIEDKYNRK
jgi:mannose-6-phosphate isomerase-like protein (cupin superfamily)